MKGTRLISWLIIAAAFGVTLFLGASLKGMRIEGGTVFLPPGHPVEQQIDRMERAFGSSDIVTVMMRSDSGSIFNPHTLSEIATITDELEAVPGVHEVQSLSNTDYLRGTPGGMSVEKLMAEVPQTPSGVHSLLDRALGWEMYRGLFFSSDLSATQWVVTLDSGRARQGGDGAAIKGIQDVIARHQTPSQHFMLAGEIAVKALLVGGITRDLTYLLPILVVVLIAILFFAFRRPGGVVLPLSTVIMSTIWTMGIMALAGVPINIMGTAIPLLLVTVGSAYGIHFLSHYYEELGPAAASAPAAQPALRSDAFRGHLDAVRRTISKVGLPILLAGVTTVAGFGSLGSASVPAILQMGVFTAVGILCALLLTFTFVPAVLLLARGTRPRAGVAAGNSGSRRAARPASRAKRLSSGGRTVRLLTGVYDGVARRPLPLAGAVVLLAGVAVFGVSRIQVGQPTIDFFRPASPIRQAAHFADSNFGGSTVMYVVVHRADESFARQAAGAGDRGGATSSAAPAGGPAASDPFGGEARGVPFGRGETPPGGGSGEGGVAAFGGFGDLSKLEPTAQPSTPGVPSIAGPRMLAAVEGLERHLRDSYPGGVGRVSSLTMMIEQMNRVMHSGEAAYYEIPTDPGKYGLADEAALRRLIAQYLLLYSGNLSSFVDSTDRPSQMRIVVQLENGSPAFLEEVKRDIDAYARAHFQPLGYAAETVGLPDEMLAMNRPIMRSQVISVTLALVGVFIALWLAYRSIRIALAGLVPIALSLLLNFAAMGFLHIPLDIVTAMIASVAIGIGIDYSIHVVSSYVLEYRRTGDSEKAAHHTLRLTGRAIFFNVASVTVGFAVLVFSMFTPLNSLGILMGVIMVTSSFFSLTLLPVLLRAIVPRLGRERKGVVEPQPASAAVLVTAERRKI